MTRSHNLHETLKPGLHRPIYLWAGPGTVRMNRLKFMRAAVDETVHLEAHTPQGARRAVHEASSRWIYLAYNWGFPPEVEEEDWRSFEAAAAVYHAAGAFVFAYIQTSNCVFAGSFKTKDWYAQDPRGRRVPYYTGRSMTCWEAPEWQAQLKERVLDALQRGADGIFFDNPWHGAQPMYLGGAWLGPAGCYCPRCRALYQSETDRPIPHEVIPGYPESDAYLRWRAERVAHVLSGLADQARAHKPGVVISVNDFDAIIRPSYVTYGIHLESLARVQDVVMIEDYGLPRWDEGSRPRLANNALTLRTARALCGETPLSVDAYELGIGFDRVFPARRYQQAIAEAAACRASAVIKGTEFIDQDGRFTLLTALPYTEIRTHIGEYQDWIAARAELLEGGVNAAPVGLLYPGSRLWETWPHLAARYFGCGQALLAAGIPWRTVTAEDRLDGLRALLVFDEADLHGIDPPSGLPLVNVTTLPGWQNPTRETLLARSAWLRHAVAGLTGAAVRAYFASRLARGLLDAVGIMRLFTGNPFFALPKEPAITALLSALPEKIQLRVEAEAPVLLELWKQGNTMQVHLVNYATEAQRVVVHFPQPVRARLLSPERIGEPVLSGQTLKLNLDVYAILVVKEKD
jgi:hypothetical protein